MFKKAALATVIFSVVAAIGVPRALAQTQDTAKPAGDNKAAQTQADNKADQPQQQATPDAAPSLYYEVVMVKGHVRMSPLGTDPMADEGWTRVKLGDRLVEGMQLSTSIRSAVKFTAVPSDPPTVMLIERATLIAITELEHDGSVAKCRMALAHGAVKAGVSEGKTRSDMEIASPVATLSKRGTDIFRIEYRNNRFKMELSAQGRGLVEAIQTRASTFGGRDQMRSRYLTPGQWISHRMLRAIDEVSFDRTVDITDAFGLQGYDQMFTQMQGNGLGFLFPGSTNLVNFLDVVNADGRIGVVPSFDPDSQINDAGLVPTTNRPGHNPAYGNFGIGQGGIPSIFGRTKTSDAALQKQRDFRDRINTVRAVRRMIRGER